MTDLFQKNVQEGYRKIIEGVIADCPQHTFMMLTKRAENMRDYFNGNLPYANLQLGVTVEGPETLHRIDDLRKIKSAKRFVSFEPLLADPGKVNLDRVSWCIVGCESGPHRRPMNLNWARSLRDQAVAAGVPFFLKQADLGRGMGRITKIPAIDGKRWTEFLV
jgi:protein gp37